ncbi:MAG: sugar phosphate isomerase/epimerase [Gemmataceae bacterium]|nr:sugar phosphate isomerase/epimerase [Gemmataceae bacterium]
MPRPVILYSGSFTDMPLADLAPRVAEWGYAGLELVTWGGHFAVPGSHDDDEGSADTLATLAGHDLSVPVLGAYRVGQAVCDIIDDRHQSLLPAHVWGDGDPAGVRARATQEMIATIRAAQRLGATVVSGFTGSPLWSFVNGYPGPSSDRVDAGFAEFARAWHPILDVCGECGIRFALEVHPGQIAFDYYTAERTLEALDHRPEFGFTVDPAHLHWQGVDPAAFVRKFGERVYHVHMKDIFLRLDGRGSVLNSCLPYGDPRRGWEFRSPGRGGIAWDEFIRALNAVGYEGPLAVDYRDDGLDREFGVQDALGFVKQLDYPAPRGVFR